MQVRVLKIADGKIQLTMKSEDERKQESDMSESGVGAGGTKKARNTLEAALARVGFKHTPEAEVLILLTCIPWGTNVQHNAAANATACSCRHTEMQWS